MQRRHTFIAAAIALSATGLLTGPALADAIDGDWCNRGDHFNIEGSNILTPGRNRIQGHYGRYRFTYIVPANEPGAGTEMSLVMIRGQEIVHMRRAGQTGDPMVWQRCKPIS